jgi:hypothetical protein
MQILLNWLAGDRNFSVGATIYQAFGTNQPFKDLLNMGETPFARELLSEELEKMYKDGVPDEEPPSLMGEQDTDTAVMPPSDNEILQALTNEWQPFYQRMNFLRHELDKFGNSNSAEAIEWRQPRAREIKVLEKQCIAIWKKRDYFLKHNKLPFVPEIKKERPVDPVKLATLISNTKNYIRRYRLKMEQEPGEPKYAQLYLKYKNEHKDLTGEEYEEKD